MSVQSVSAYLRILPPGMTIRRPQRMIERHLTAYRRHWMIIVSGFFEPLFFLLSMRAGVGSLVGDVSFGGKMIPYDHFVAPGLMAASAMNGAIFDSTGNVFGRLRHQKLYDAVLATPMEPSDVAVGEIGWALLRGQIYAIGFLGVMLALGQVGSPWVLLALPACALIGLCFAAIGFACTTYMRTWADIDIVNTLVMPMLLFSATFFPASSYGRWGWVVQISPLYHGVAVVRSANAGVWTNSIIGHLAVLVILSTIGVAIAARRINRLLRS
ncbi:MAG TPA: ABC transporter permease [Ilumatobacteraceae bacterium]|nr:ABC transporter permease [Ilumatobacteraceae bacterium]